MSDTRNKGMHPVAAGVAGAVVGAGLAVLATKALSDEKTRRTVVKKMNDFKAWGQDALKQLNASTEDMRDTAEEMGENLKSEAKGKMDEMESSPKYN